MPNPNGYTGIFRYSDQYPDATQAWWADTDDLEDVIGELRWLIDDELTSPLAAELVAHRESFAPGYRTRAAAFWLPRPPWATTDPRGGVWLLYWEGDSTFNVVEYPTRDEAVAAFLAHVAHWEAEGEPYDFVAEPQRRRTALPPGLALPAVDVRLPHDRTCA